MPPQAEWPPPGLQADDILEGVSTLFESLGRALVCVNRNFQIVHASKALDRLIGPGAAKSIVGLPVESVLGRELFGDEGSLRRALSAGDRREGWDTSRRSSPSVQRPWCTVTRRPATPGSPM
jgi:hypothetical protein